MAIRHLWRVANGLDNATLEGRKSVTYLYAHTVSPSGPTFDKRNFRRFFNLRQFLFFLPQGFSFPLADAVSHFVSKHFSAYK